MCVFDWVRAYVYIKLSFYLRNMQTHTQRKRERANMSEYEIQVFLGGV